MNSLPSILADLVLLLHFAWVFFVVAAVPAVVVGALLGKSFARHCPFRLIHLGMMTFVFGETALGIPCPLTVWEQQLRAAAGEGVYAGDFIPNLLQTLMFWDFPPWFFILLYGIFTLLILLLFLFIRPRCFRRN